MIVVRTPSKEYEVHIGSDILEHIGQYAAALNPPGRAVIVTDRTVDRLYSPRLETSLRSVGYDTVKYVIPTGEKSKNTGELISLLNFMAHSRLTRTSTVFALGGGVVGDLSGLAAALYMRGTGLVQIPTTLLAAVDSSVGGKTAVNLGTGKNLAGVFYQPDLVFCDTGTLPTLPKEEFANGCAEAIKYAFIRDASILNMLISPGQTDTAALIKRCVEIKRDIVSQDERECGERQLLNFGHTFGHAIEKCSGYTLPHGSAVASGMTIMTAAAVRRGLCEPSCLIVLKNALERYELPLSTTYSVDELFNVILSDKKRSNDSIVLVVPRRVGFCELMRVSLSEAREHLALGLKD